MPRFYPSLNQSVTRFSLAVLMLALPVFSQGQCVPSSISASSTVPGYLQSPVYYPPNYTVAFSVPRTITDIGPAQGNVSGAYYNTNSFTGALSASGINGIANTAAISVGSQDTLIVVFVPITGQEQRPTTVQLRFSDVVTGKPALPITETGYFWVVVSMNNTIAHSDVLGEFQTSNANSTVVKWPLSSFFTLSTNWNLHLNAPGPGGGGNGFTQSANAKGVVTIECLTPNCYLTHYNPCTNTAAEPPDNPYAIANPQLQSITFNPEIATAGLPLTGYVHLTAPAPPGGCSVSLVSGNPALASVPANVSVLPGQMWASFPITTRSFTNAPKAEVSLTAKLKQSANLIPTLVLYYALPSSLTLTPSKVKGGISATGTITLNSPAPAGGLTIVLSSDNSTAIRLPSGVKVPSGATSATFPIKTLPVAAGTTTTVTISGKYATTVTGQLSISN